MANTLFFDGYTTTLSLVSRLQSAGLGVLDAERVKAHKTSMYAKHRTGIWKHLFLIPQAYFRSCDFVIRYVFAISLISALIVTVAFILLIEPSASLGAYLGWICGVFMLGLVLPFGTVLALAAALPGDGSSPFFRAGQYWMKDDYQLWRFAVPENLQRRADQALRIPGVRVHLERFGSDPLIFAVSGREAVCIGGWDTGDRYIDSF